MTSTAKMVRDYNKSLTLTDRIYALLQESIEVGDLAMRDICRKALNDRDKNAIRECKRVLDEADAMLD